jgi:hypothetical protein
MNMKENAGKRRQLMSSAKDEDIPTVEMQPLVTSSTIQTEDARHLMDKSDHERQSSHKRSYSLTPLKTRFSSLFVSERNLSPKDYTTREQQVHDTTTETSRIKNILPMNMILTNPKGFMFSLRAKDKRDATGKKGYRVNVPTRLIMYISIIFLVVPLLVGLILLIRTLLGMHSKTEVVGGISHNENSTLGNSTSMIEGFHPILGDITNTSVVEGEIISENQDISEDLVHI